MKLPSNSLRSPSATMKLSLTTFTTLLLAPLVALHGAPFTDSHIIIASEAGAKLDSDVTQGGGTDDTALSV